MTSPNDVQGLNHEALLEGATPGPWIADDFCEDSGQATRLGSYGGHEHYYHSTTTLAYFQTTDADDLQPGQPRVGIITAERNARLAAAAPQLARQCIDQAATIAQLQQRVEEMRELLRPFADAADDLDDKHRDGSEIWEAPAAMSITAGDLRRAALTLNDRSAEK